MSISKTFIKTKNSFKVTFEVPKELLGDAKQIKVLGDFNDWNTDKATFMKNTKGIFKTVKELEAGKKYEFRYLTDDNKWINDANADDYVASPHFVDNCVLDLTV